jgi:Fe-S-cluster containining protein
MSCECCPDCSRCAGSCCKRLEVLLCGEDIARLRLAGHSDFVDVWADGIEETAGAEALAAASDFLGWMGNQGTLKKRNGACVFLDQKPDGTSRCSVYDDRPGACREYHQNKCGGIRELVIL